MKSAILKFLLFHFLFISAATFAQRNDFFTDTIAFPKTVKPHRFSIRHCNRLLNEKKISVVYALRDSTVFLVRHQLDTFSNLGILVRDGKKARLYRVFGPRNYLVDTSWKECNGKPGKELILRWTYSESREHDYGVYSGTRSGIEIWDMVSFRKIVEMETSSCGQGWNMCTGKSHYGCGLNIHLEFRNDTLIFEDIYRYSHTEKRYVEERERGSEKLYSYQIEVEVSEATIYRYVYVYSENGLLKKSMTVKQFSGE